MKVRDIPELSQLTHPYAAAVGTEGRLYVAGVKVCHIINSNFSKCHTFAEGCGQAFAIAVNTVCNVYVPMQDENTVCVFSPSGDMLFKFGEPDNEPSHKCLSLFPCLLLLVLKTMSMSG